MALHIRIAARRDIAARELWEMHRQRAKVFKDRLGWEVLILSGMEIDGYDALEPFYMLIRAPAAGAPGSGPLIGSWRLLPTQGPYMLKDSFSALLHGQAAPSHARIWELSRFAIETGRARQFGFSAVSLESIAQVIRYGVQGGIDEYVTVTTTAIERLLRRAGVVMRRFGEPLQIGVEQAVALHVDVGATYRALFHTELASSTLAG